MNRGQWYCNCIVVILVPRDLVLDKSQAADIKSGKFLLRSPRCRRSPNPKRVGQERREQRTAQSHGFLSGRGNSDFECGWMLAVYQSLLVAEEKARQRFSFPDLLFIVLIKRVDVASGIWRPPLIFPFIVHFPSPCCSTTPLFALQDNGTQKFPVPWRRGVVVAAHALYMYPGGK